MFDQLILFKWPTRWEEGTVFTITTTPDNKLSRVVSVSTHKGVTTTEWARLHVLNPAHYFIDVHFITS